MFEKKFYVYELIDPDGKVFYVGKGSRHRWNKHRANAERGQRTKLYDRIREIWKSGNDFSRRKIFQTNDEQEAFTKEIEMIAFYGRINLTNDTDGGDGMSNPSESTREKLRHNNIGKTLSSEHRAKIAESHLGIRPSKETLIRLSESHKGQVSAMKGKHHTEEAKEKNRQAHLGKKLTITHRKKISIGLKIAYAIFRRGKRK